MERKIKFFTIEQVLDLHDAVLAAHGGIAGIRDLSLLDAALAMPKQSFGGEFLHPTLPEMAAAYLFHLCQNHAFLDGNKRVAVAACELFLNGNGLEIDADDDAITELTLQVASGRMSKAEAAAFIEKHIRKLGET